MYSIGGSRADHNASPTLDGVGNLTEGGRMSLNTGELNGDIDGLFDKLLGQSTEVPDALAEVATVTLCADQDVCLGGDFVDTFPISDTSMALFMGDFVGHDSSLARKAVVLKFLVRRLVSAGLSVSEIMERASALVGNAMPDQYASAFLGRLDLIDGRLEYSSAGHEPGVIFRPNGTESLEISGMLLGVLSNPKYESHVVNIAGATLALYTDGLTEAVVNQDRTRYGTERLTSVLNSRLMAGHSLSEVASMTFADIADACVKEPLSDDATLLLIRPLVPLNLRME